MNRFWELVDRAILALQGVAFVTITLSVGGQIICRTFFNSPLEFPEELSVFLLIGIVYFGVVVVERRDAHIRVGLVLDRMPESTGRMVLLLSRLLALGFVLVLLKGETALVSTTRQLKSSAAQFPLWWVHLALSVACILWAAAIATDLARTLAGRGYSASTGP